MTPRPLWIAGRFLSRLPFPDPGPVEPVETGRSVPWYPVVGLLMGLLAGAIAAGLAWLGTPPDVAAILTLMVWVWASGALHLDGLADTADAWIGGLGDRARTLAIMKDPRSGPAAVTTLVLALIAKWAGIKALILADALAPLLVLPMLGRALLPLLLLTTPYAREHGMARDQSRELPRRAAWVGILGAVGGALLVMGWQGLAMVLTALIAFLIGRRAMLRRLAGFTGDTAGAQVEVTETLMLMVCVILS